ncbi:unnamed protein product [Closterium sp. NIES-53]
MAEMAPLLEEIQAHPQDVFYFVEEAFLPTKLPFRDSGDGRVDPRPAWHLNIGFLFNAAGTVMCPPLVMFRLEDEIAQGIENPAGHPVFVRHTIDGTVTPEFRDGNDGTWFPQPARRVREPVDEDVEEVLPPPPVLAPLTPVADWPASTLVSAIGDEGSLESSPVAPASGIASGRQGAKLVKPATTGEQQTGEPVKQEAAAGEQSTGEQQTGRSKGKLSKSAEGEQPVKGSQLLAGEESIDSDVVEVPMETSKLQSSEPELRRSSQTRRPPKWLSYHAYLPPTAFTTVCDDADDDLLYDDVEVDVDLPELDPAVNADPEHRWDIATMMVKEALASWKGEAVKAAMDEEKCSLIGMGTWELGFTQVYGADYDETYTPVSSYVTLRIFLSIVTVLDLNLMQLDVKNTFPQGKLDRVLYVYPPVTCSVLVYVDDLLAASSSTAMLKELLEAAFELHEISLVVKCLGLEIVRDRPARKLWLHQQDYADKLCRRFIDEEQGGRIPKTPASVDAYTKLTFDNKETQEHEEEEEYRQTVSLLQFVVTTMRPDIAFACSKLGSGLTVRSDQHWREVDRCLAYLADTGETALEFGGGPELLELICYVDADDAGDNQNRTSTGGYLFIYGGAAVSWSSSRIKCATLSLTESEYVAATDVDKEGCRLRFLLAEFKQLDAGKPTVLRVDNKSAITVAEGLGLTGNLKHMERRYAWLQHMVRRGKFVLRYILTTEQPADFLTKALHFLAFNQCFIAIGQVRLANVGKLIAPLTDLLRKGGENMCEEKEHAAFSALKQILCSPPFLHIADPHRPSSLSPAQATSPSESYCCMTSGTDFSQLRRSPANFTRPSTNYTIHDREMLAIVHAFKVWR